MSVEATILTADAVAEVKRILAAVRPLAVQYYRLTGKPLGVTGEVAEFVASELLGLELARPRTDGYDAIRKVENGIEQRIQIKGRAFEGKSAKGRLGRIKIDCACDKVMLVLLDRETLEAREIWETDFAMVAARLAEPGSRARNEKGALAVSDFKRMSKRIWPASIV